MLSASRCGLLPALLFVLAWFGPTVVRADIVIHDGGVTKDRDATQQVVSRTGNRPTLVLSDDVLSGPTHWLSEGVDVERCEGEQVSLDVPARVEDLAEFVLGFELDKAYDGLRLVRTLLPCNEAPVSSRDLARLSFLLGATLADQGNPEAAAAAMAEAVATDPTYEGERGFPKTHEELLEAARAATPEERPRVHAWLGPGMNEAFLDGAKVEFPGQDGLKIGAGRHLLQVSTPHGLKGMWLEPTSEPAAVLWPGSGRAIWEDGGRSPGGRLGMQLLLRDEFGGREGDVHVLHYRGRRVSGATYPSGGGPRKSWTEPVDRPVEPPVADARPADDPPADDPPADDPTTDDPTTDDPTTDDPATDDPQRTTRRPARQQKDPPTGATGPKDDKLRRFRIALTVGYHGSEPFSYGMVGLDLHVVLVGPLQVGAFLRPSYGGVHDFPVPEGDAPVSGPVFLVPFGFHVGVRKEGWLSPWVGGAFQYAYNRDGLRAAPSLLGFAAQGGLDVSPNDSMLVLRVMGEVGLLGLHFNGRISGGVGVRF